MTKNGFLQLLDSLKYSFEEIDDKIIITHYTNVYLNSVESIPENVIFNNKSSVYMEKLKTISEGVEFRNKGSVNLKNLTVSELREGVFFNTGSFWCDDFNNINWECDITGIRKGSVLNLMIKRQLFV